MDRFLKKSLKRQLPSQPICESETSETNPLDLGSSPSPSQPSSPQSTTRSSSKSRSTASSSSAEIIDLDCAPSAPPSAKKPKKQPTKFSDTYTKLWPFIKPSSRGVSFAYCAPCRGHISIGSGGKDDIRKHVISDKHERCVKEEASVPPPKISEFMKKDNDNSVIRAEVLWTQFVIDNNLPLAVSDKFGSLLKKMCTNPDVPKKFACGRTKTAAIAACISKQTTADLVQKMQRNSFSLGTDGSNDHDSKLYPMVITINDETSGTVTTELLSVPELQESSTASNITNLIKEQLTTHSIPLSNCLSFISDNANVMVGKKGGVSTLLKKEQPNMLSLGCGCHLLNLAAKKSVSVLPIKIDEFLTDVYYYFHHSDKKLAEFNDVQAIYNEETRKILKYCPTRWLCLTTSLKRIVELWQPLLDYFQRVKEEEDEKKKKKEKKTDPKNAAADSIINSWFTHDNEPSTSSSKTDQLPQPPDRLNRILEILKSKRSLIYCTFLLWIMPLFDKYNRLLQSEEPLIHKLKDLYLAFYRDLLTKFVKPDVIQRHTLNLLDVKFSDEKNHISEKDLYVGEATQGLMSSLKSKSRAVILENLKLFYSTALLYMKDNFPIMHEVLQHAQFVNIQQRQHALFAGVTFFFKRTPLEKECTLDQLHEEFQNFQSSDLPPAVLKATRIDEQWNALLHYTNPLDQTKPYENIAKLALNVLTIPHSNASSERVFSLVRKMRSESRSSMTNKTLNTLLVSKVRASTSRSSLQLTDDFLRKCKSATVSSLHSN